MREGESTGGKVRRDYGWKRKEHKREIVFLAERGREAPKRGKEKRAIERKHQRE